MLINAQQSMFMIVKIKRENRNMIFIPIPIYIFVELVDAIEDLTWLINKFLPKSYDGIYHISNLLCETLYEIRKHGQWTMAEIDVEDYCIQLEFY